MRLLLAPKHLQYCMCIDTWPTCKDELLTCVSLTLCLNRWPLLPLVYMCIEFYLLCRAIQTSTHLPSYPKDIVDPQLQKVSLYTAPVFTMCMCFPSPPPLPQIASMEPDHAHISHDNNDDLPPPLTLPKANHPPNTVSHLPQSSRPIAYPVEASQHHRVEADGMTSLVNIPYDPNLVCPVCRRMFRKGEIQLYKQHVELCKAGDIAGDRAWYSVTSVRWWLVNCCRVSACI